MFGMSRLEFDEMVQRGKEDKWKDVKTKWFCTPDTTKVPGLLKGTLSTWIFKVMIYILSGKRNNIWILHWPVTQGMFDLVMHN